MTLLGFPCLVEAVQRNCHIADARHARDMTMCTYLLEMREYYRWEHEMPLDAVPPREDLSRWLAEREAYWADLEAEDFGPLPIDGELLDPFHVEAVNRALMPIGMVYGAGYGRLGKPHFFLGERLREETRDSLKVIVSGCEYARDLTGLPAALQGETIWLRQESLRRWLWEKVEIWGVRRPDGPLASALGLYGFDGSVRPALERMTEREGETLILHELGEAQAQRLLGSDWGRMIMSLHGRRAELLARAARDNLADCLVTLPTLLERGERAALHFWFANFDGLRRALFPRLANSYAAMRAGDDAPLVRAIDAGRSHWAAACGRIVELYRAQPEQADAAIEALLPEGVSPLAL